MKNNILNYIGGGIKCDNPECDFVDQYVKVEDYDKWLNKPCPKCGSNLLTQADYDNVQMLLNIVGIVNKNYVPIEGEPDNSGKHTIMTFNFDGSGKMDIEINETEG